MAIKLDLVGRKSPSTPFTYRWKDVVLYALGVGAKVDELDFLYEARGPKVLPTFAVVPSFTAMLSVAGELGAKIELVRNAFLKNRTDGALVRLSSPVQGGVEQTTERLVAYVQALYPVLPEYLPN